MSALELRDVSKVYGEGANEVHALRGVDLSVEAGALVAVMGPSGSGKSTLLTIAGTLEVPSNGEVVIDGVTVSAMSRNDRARMRRRSIGYVFQNFNLLAGLSALENVCLPMELDGIAARKARVAGMEALEELGLSDRASSFPDDLSGGERQRVAIARAVVGDRHLLLADEPSGALDSANAESVIRLIRAACRARCRRSGGHARRGIGVVGRPRRVPARRPRGRPDHAARRTGIAARAGNDVVSLALEERPRELEIPSSGGGPARRAIYRWSWRLFQREWRQQILVVALMVFAVAATTVGIALVYNAGLPLDSTMGTATGSATFVGADRADVAAAQRAFGLVEEIDHQSIAIPGTLNAVDLRAQDPNGPFGHPTLRLVSGHYPTGPDQIAMTAGAAANFSVHVGDPFVANGVTRQVVGLVENPLDLNDEFALVAPGQANPPAQVTILFNATGRQIDAFRPTGNNVGIGTRSTLNKTATAIVVLALETIGLLFVGLVAAAGFAVMAQRRLRALGMLGALGATDRQVRLAMIANGMVVGVVGAVVGAALGLATWIALAPRFESLVNHRVDRFHLQWWAIAAAMLLAVVTAVVAAWWPARAAARSSIVAALSGRPAPPKPAHRFAGAGIALLAVGFTCLAFAHPTSERPNPFLVIGGTMATVFGMLFVGPLFIRGLAVLGRRAPIALRLALRDLARYQARSAAALGAISLALAIAATVAISAAAAAVPPAEPNLANNQAVVSLGSGNSPPGSSSTSTSVPTAADLQSLQTRINSLGATLHAQAVIPLGEAVDASSSAISGAGTMPGDAAMLGQLTIVTHGANSGIKIAGVIPLYVATPALLAHYGIDPSTINPNTDIITGRTDLDGYSVIAPRSDTTPCDASQPKCEVNGAKPGPDGGGQKGPDHWKPTIQTVKLPKYTSAPDTLLTAHALQAYGLKSVVAGWFIQTPSPLTTDQINTARHTAAAAGVTVETREKQPSNAGLRNGATAVGLLVALGVLAMTVGLIRSETANELRTLTATGATSTTRRTITGSTAGALAFLGAILGTGGAYLALLAWHRGDLHPLTQVPYVDLVIIIVGLPLLAIAAGWLLAGREPTAISHQPLE